MLTKEATLKTLYYWRFERDMKMIATEVDMKGWVGDIVCSDRRCLIETEIKISIDDLKFDLSEKRTKHDIISKEKKSIWYEKKVPNKLFYALPEDLVPLAEIILKDFPVGILKISNAKKVRRSVSVVKRAPLINEKYPTTTERSLINRMGSEIVRCRLYGVDRLDIEE